MHNIVANSNLAKRYTIDHLLNRSRQHCVQALLSEDISSIAFGHWLAIPSQQLLLVFRHQQCVAIECVAIECVAIKGYQVAV